VSPQAHGLPSDDGKRRFGVADVIAGVSVALILIPQSLAYAVIAGVPPRFGMYSAALPPIAAAPFASSPYLQTGPVAMTALLTFGALSAVAEPFTSQWIELAALLALAVGVVRLAFGLLRLGFIAYFMSQPVVLGFTIGAGILIIASQIPSALGSMAPDGGLLERAGWALVHPGSWDWATIAYAVATAITVEVGRFIGPRFPGVLLAVAAAILTSLAFGFDGATVGDVPSEFIPFSFDLPWDDVPGLALSAVVIALVGFAEPAAIARTFAAQDRQRWSANREFISQGAANLASGISGGFPVGGSFSRSSVNRLAGARTRWSGAVTGAIVVLFIPIAWVLEPLPRSVLAAIVITAVIRLIRPDKLLVVWRSSKPQGIIALVALVATLVLAPRVDLAVLLAVALAIAVHLGRELRVDVDTWVRGDTLRFRPQGVVFFASASRLTDQLIDQLAEFPDVTELELDLSGVGRMDYTGARALGSVVSDARWAGLEVRVINVPPQLERFRAALEGQQSSTAV
jgi:SulP family sulfate permease